eukprot:TRINITY_DN1730_c0_g5_i1.p1 TRINITY_DN1730_c0_g5~~TRINITY_DN1730_c0_g5_i1.p1  ORF type:complete len:831 (+),score=202.38 TRINITY_DN1730_c0_g5_i1:99-2591(+)
MSRRHGQPHEGPVLRRRQQVAWRTVGSIGAVVLSSAGVSPVLAKSSEAATSSLDELKGRKESLIDELRRLKAQLAQAGVSPPETNASGLLQEAAGDEAGSCRDNNGGCPSWAAAGECQRNAEWMRSNCRKSCHVCSSGGGSSSSGGCSDSNGGCPSWAAAGECQRNAAWMKAHCKKSCHVCSGGGGGSTSPSIPGGPPDAKECDTVQECDRLLDPDLVCSKDRLACYRAVDWAMNNGAKSNPDWYPGLTPESHFEDFQQFMYVRKQEHCPKPCPWSPPTTTTTTTTTTTPPRGTPACPPRPRMPAPPSHPLQYNGISWPELCYVGLGEEHVFLIGDWGGIQENGKAKPAPNNKGHREYVKGIDDKAQLLVAEQFNKRAAVKKPRYVLNGGDNFYWAGIRQKCGKPAQEALKDFIDPRKPNTRQIHTIFESVYKGPGVDGIPWLSVFGNHDYGGFQYNYAWDQQIYYTWGPTGRWIMPGQYWHQHVKYPTKGFSVDYYMIDTCNQDTTDPEEDPLHNICSLENNMEKDGTYSTCKMIGGPSTPYECVTWFQNLWDKQMLWLDDMLGKSKADWQIIVTHFPPETWVHYSENVDDWKEVGDKHGIDLMLASHRHRQEVHPLGSWSLKAGFPFVVCGGGGGVTSEDLPDYNITTVEEWHELHPENKKSYPGGSQYGFMDMTIGKDLIHIQAINFDGQLRENIEVRQRLPGGKTLVTCKAIGCGQYSRHYSCNCNFDCQKHGSCCDDFETTCPGLVKIPDTCARNGCGAPFNKNADCQCNTACRKYNSCCDDFIQSCPHLANPPTPPPHGGHGGYSPPPPHGGFSPSPPPFAPPY